MQSCLLAIGTVPDVNIISMIKKLTMNNMIWLIVLNRRHSVWMPSPTVAKRVRAIFWRWESRHRGPVPLWARSRTPWRRFLGDMWQLDDWSAEHTRLNMAIQMRLLKSSRELRLVIL